MTLQQAGTTPLTTAWGRDAQGRINSFSSDGTVQATYTYEPGTGEVKERPVLLRLSTVLRWRGHQ